MDTTGTDLFPQIRDRIESDSCGTLRKIETQDRAEFDEHVRVREVEVDLVMAKGGPDVTSPRRGCNGTQQRVCAWPGDHRQVRVGICCRVVIATGRTVLEKLVEPVALG